MLDISDLGQLSQQLIEAKKALETLDAELGALYVDPHDETSVQAEIARIHATIDTRIGPYAANPIIAPLAANLKAQYRASILAQAAAARQGDTGKRHHG
jgi:hypothetical protein